MVAKPQFGIEQLRMVTNDAEKVILDTFRTIEMFLRAWAGLEKVPIASVFDKVYEGKRIGELLYQQLKTLKRLRNDVIHQAYRPKVGDGLIAIGTLQNLYDELWDRDLPGSHKGLWPESMSVDPSPSTLLAARHHWRDFQELTRRFFEGQTGLRIAEEVEIELPAGAWRADLVSLDRSLVIECKSYTWTKGGNVPAAKLEHARMACRHLAETSAHRKVLVFQDDELKGKSLAQYFARLNRALLNGVEVWRYWNKTFERLNSNAAPTVLM